ncbi:MAG TPA: hypothetical protein VNC15_10505 [Solirubrobacterales bacterium]|jgi:hypothetical protein|nr:hypothetical protein [Solirubrobacterales bacterium]
MKKLKGPELKLSQLKVPPIFRDVYQDLRDRRLLPLVALVLLAIVAVPLLLSSGAPSEPAPPASAGGPEADVESAQLTVVKAAPGLRQPGKRFSDRQAKDPFRQHHTGAAVGSESVTTGSNPATAPIASGESSGPSESSAAPSVTPEESPGNTDGGSATGGSDHGGGGPGSTVDPGDLVYYTFAADVTITKIETDENGKKVTGKPQTRRGVLPSTVLPGDKRQVVTYMGISPKTQKPLLLVSTDVTGVFGDGKCAAGSESCQLLEMKLTFPETFVYGEAGVRYKVNIIKITPVATGHS